MMTFATSKTRFPKLILTAFLLLITLAITTTALAQGRSRKPIRLISGDYFPEIVTPTQARSLQKEGFDGNYFKIIQFVEIPSEAQRTKWAAEGLHLVDYLHDDTYFAVIDLGFNLTSITDEAITIIDVANLFKVEAELAAQQQVAGFTASKFVVSYYATLDAQRVIADLKARGVIIEAHRDYSRQLDIIINPWQLNSIIGLPYLQFVGAEPAEGVLEPLDFRNSSGRTNYLNTGYMGLNYTGDGVTIAVGESGTAGGHIDFKGRLIEFSGGSPGSHKIPVMQNGGGAGNLDPTNRNNAVGATLLSTGSGPDYAALHDSHGLRFTNHSLGYGISGGYDSTARNHDLRTATYPLHLVLYSAGNSGGSTGFAPYNGFSGWANITGQRKQNKTHFGIGSLNASDNIAGFSSRGPMYDGRVYPQLIIEGGGGTSFAAPKITGLLAILSEAYQDLNSGTEPPASLLRAILMNTADEVDDPGPDYKSGYGRPNMRRAYNIINNAQHLTDSVAHGGSNSHVIAVPANTEQVRVMIVWPDVAAAVNANPAIVNNLDLLLTDPAATMSYNPWVLDHTANTTNLDAPATRQVDSLNTIEQVTVDNPAAGNWTVDVSGTNVPMGPQIYYLVYEFLMDELLMAFPLENERFVPGDTYRIKWDSYPTSGDTFTLDYQLDGSSWVNIVTGRDANSRNYDWTAPNVGTGIHTIEFRVQRGAITAESGVNYIGERPTNVAVDWACADVVKLSWEAVAGATGYTVHRLGAKYMEPVVSNITFDGTSAILIGLSTTEDESFAVAAVTTANEGMRTNAITKAVGDINCFNAKTTTASSVDKTDITLNGLINPHNSTLTAVHFEYGPTNAYGSTTANIPTSATGHDEEAVSATIASALTSRTDVMHYRLVVTKDGSPVFGADQEIRLAPGNDFTFDGTDDYLDAGLADQITGNSPRSITAWAYTDSFNNGGIFQAGATGTTSGDFSLRTLTTDDRWRVQLWGTGEFDVTLTGSKGAWHHYALTYDGTTVRLYYDGNFVNSSNVALNTLPQDVYIGRWRDDYFDGQIDEVTHWNKALSESEIRDLMHQPLDGTETGLVNYFMLDGRSGSVFDAISGREIPINGGMTKTTSSTPFGVGAEFTTTEINGAVTFTDTDFEANYSSQNGATVIVSKIEVEPNSTSGIDGGSTIFDDQYWVAHRHGTGNFAADVTFGVAEDLTAADASAPAQIQLFGRDKGSEGDWSFVALANSIDDTNDEATFNGITTFDKQFIIARNTNPFISIVENSLPFVNMKAGSLQQHAYTLRGVNLTANLNVTPPTGFLVSTNGSSGFVASLSLTPAGGLVSETIYVRYDPANAGTASGTVVNSSSGASDVNVPINAFEAVAVADYATQAIDLDGSNDYFQVQNFDWNPNSVFTVEWWLKPDTNINWNQQVGNGWGNFLFHTNSSGTVSAGITNNS
ncbi:MAG: LamG-like jellyroll fold domain-containing protein, partial [Chloroflexota bacterium]